MALIKAGSKAKVVIVIINTHFSIFPSNEAFTFAQKKPSITQHHTEPAFSTFNVPFHQLENNMKAVE